MGKGFFRIALPIIVIAAIIGGLSLLGVRNYNALQLVDEDVKAGWAYVVNQYQRRADLVPNLVRVVQAYAVHERAIFREVAEARAAALKIKPDAALLDNPKRLAEYQAAQSNIQQTLSKLLMIAENYPELRSNESFLDLQVQLEGTENRITHAREKYIFAINNYNIMVRIFPSNLLASRMNYKVRENLVLEPGSTADKAPEVVFK